MVPTPDPLRADLGVEGIAIKVYVELVMSDDHATLSADPARVSRGHRTDSSIADTNSGLFGSAAAGWVAAGLFEAVDGAPRSAELVGYLTGDVGGVAVFGG